MRRYQIAFCGYGSIAKRHLKNIQKLLDERGDSYSIDLIRHGNAMRDATLPKCISNIYSYGDCLKSEYDIFFVTNPTSMHYGTILKYADNAKNLFVEKPIFDNANLQIPADIIKNKILYVACPLRYSGVLQYIKDNIDYQNAYAIRATSSSYLPDWRKGTDYRNTYSAKKALGGGVSIDLIHEWDYLTNFFGFPSKVAAIIDKVSNLEIDSDDIAVYIAKFNDKTAEVHLDYFGRKTMRTIELFMPDETIIGDITNSEITYLRSGKRIMINEERDDFQMRELNHFLNIINNVIPNDSTWQDAVKVLRLAKGVW